MKSASFLIAFCILVCLLPMLLLKVPETVPEISGTISVYNHLTGEVFEMNLEEYTARCMASEMPASFHKEALKAQAVAIRSYTLSKKPSDEHKGATVCTDFNHCAAFLQNEAELLPIYSEAVKETENQVLIFEGEFANTVFHAMSSGRTEDAKYVWGGSVPYLTPASCESDTKLENFRTVSEFSTEQVLKTLSVPDKSIGKIEKTESGGIKTVQIGNTSFSGRQIRSAFNLKSSAFDIEETENGLKFTVYGYGHGVGMSQYGADAFARSGMSYKEILSHFYKGTELISIDFKA